MWKILWGPLKVQILKNWCSRDFTMAHRPWVSFERGVFAKNFHEKANVSHFDRRYDKLSNFLHWYFTITGLTPDRPLVWTWGFLPDGRPAPFFVWAIIRFWPKGARWGVGLELVGIGRFVVNSAKLGQPTAYFFVSVISKSNMWGFRI